MYSISSISQLLKYFDECNNSILKVLMDDGSLVGKSNSLLYHDKGCQYKMGESNMLSLVEKIKRSKEGDISQLKYRCQRCDLLSVIIEYDIEIDKPFNIKYYECQLFKLRKFTQVYPYYKFLYMKTLCKTAMKSPREELIICKNDQVLTDQLNPMDTTKQDDGTGIIFLELDSFTNNSLITLIVRKILESNLGSQPAKYITSFVCSNTGFILEYDYPELKLRDLDEQDIKILLLQIFSSLHVLSKYEFLCGGISSDSIKVLACPMTLSYDGISLNSKFSCIHHNFEDCSVSFSRIRLYKKQNYERKDTVTIIETTLYTEKETIKLFKIKDGINVGLHNGYIRHRNAINAYLYTILLYNEKNIRDFIMSHDLYRKLWEGLWLKTEILNLEKDIKALGDINEHKVISLLKKYTMRYDAIDYIWNTLKHINLSDLIS